MQAGNALIGRRLMAMLVALCMASSAMLLFAPPAQADHIPATGPVPANCVEFQAGATGTKSPTAFPGVSVTVNSWDDTPTDPHEVEFTLAGLQAGEIVEISVKSGTDVVEDGPYGNGTHTIVSADQQAISHIRLCVSEEVDDKGKIIVRKEVTENSDTTFVFSFNASYDSDGFSLSHGQENISDDLPIGNYSVVEILPDGWDLESATCESNQAGDESTPESIDLDGGETVTCTFVNAEIPPPPPSGYACVDGEVTFIEDATDFEGTLYDTPGEAADDPDCIEVNASTTFTISGSCSVVDGLPVFTISGNVGEGVTLEVAGQTLASVGAFSIELDSPGLYAYSVTLDDGFVLAEGSPPVEGAIQVVDCGTTPPAGWACVDGEVVFIADATDFDGDLYDTQQEAADDPGCVEVEASIVVTVSGACATSGGGGVINIGISVATGATVTISGSNGAVLGTFTDDGTLAVDDGSTYSWAAVANEGFEFPAGSATSGSVTIETCVDELPFTGSEDVPLALGAAALILIGAGLLRTQRKEEIA